MQGYSATSVYDGEYIASKTNTILVTFNYRLGALGFLTTTHTDSDDTPGNFGFKVSA